METSDSRLFKLSDIFYHLAKYKKKYLIISFLAIVISQIHYYSSDKKYMSSGIYSMQEQFINEEANSSTGGLGAQLGGIFSLSSDQSTTFDLAKQLMVSYQFLYEFLAYTDSWIFLDTFKNEDDVNNLKKKLEELKPEEYIPAIKSELDYLKDSIKFNKHEESNFIFVFYEDKNPREAYIMLNKLVNYLNQYIKEKDKVRYRSTIDFLINEINTSNQSLTLQKSLGLLIERNLQKLALTESNQDFYFIYDIDKPFIPDRHSSPRRIFMILGHLIFWLSSYSAFLIYNFIREKNE